MTFRKKRRWIRAPLDETPTWKETVWLLIIWLDYGFNILCKGWFETFSARCWRLRHKSRKWAFLRRLVDAVLFFDANHCQTSFQSELDRVYSPPEMRTDAKPSAGDKV